MRLFTAKVALLNSRTGKYCDKKGRYCLTEGYVVSTRSCQYNIASGCINSFINQWSGSLRVFKCRLQCFLARYISLFLHSFHESAMYC